MKIGALIRALWRTPAGPLLLTAQVALSLMIFANVAYVVYVRFETTGRPTGMDIRNIFWISTHAYGKAYDAAAGMRADLAQLQAMPDVVAASAASSVPQTFDSLRSFVSALPELKGEQRTVIIYRMSDNFVDTLGLHLTRGRTPTAAPAVAGTQIQVTLGGEVAVTEALAQRLYGSGQAALGKPLYFSLLDGRSVTIVGVIELMQAAPYFAPGSEFVNEVVLTSTLDASPDAFYLVRARPGTRDALMARVEREFEAAAPGHFLDHIESMEKTAAMGRSDDRLNAVTLIILSSIVMAVMMLGLLGFTSFMVTARMKEIGTRRAIGATQGDILRQFLAENLLITTPGILLGCIFTLAFAFQLRLLLELPRLPVIFLASGMAFIWMAGLAAALLPALRGARVPPALATRGA